MTGIILIDVLLSYHPASLPSYPHLPYHQLAIPCIYQSKPGLPGTDKPSIRGFWMDWQVERDVNDHRTGKKWILDVAGWWDRWLFGMFQYGAGKLLVYLVTISSSDTGIMHGFWISSDTLPEEKYQCCKNSFWGRLEIYGYTRRLSCLLFNVLNIRFQICFLCCKTTVFFFFFFFHGIDVVKTSSLHFYVFSVILADKSLSLQEGMPILVMEVLWIALKVMKCQVIDCLRQNHRKTKTKVHFQQRLCRIISSLYCLLLLLSLTVA